MKSVMENFKNQCLEKHQLISVQFALTDRCNLKCKHCYVSPQQKPILNFNEIKDIIYQFKKIGCLFLVFTGGELFTRDDSLRIIELASRNKFCITLMTNGTLIDKSVAKFLKKNYIFDIILSLYGSQPEIHDGFTGQDGSFDKTITGIINLKQEKLKVYINYVMTKYNSTDVLSMRKLEEKMGLKVHYSSIICPKENGQRLSEDLTISKKELLKNIALDRDKIDFLKMPSPQKHSFNKPLCSAWLNKCYITAYGEVRACVAYPVSYALGDLKRESFGKIWGRDMNLNNVSMREITIKNFQNCNSCNLLDYCSLCPAHAILEEGRLGPIKQKCMMAEAKREFIETLTLGGGENNGK